MFFVLPAVGPLTLWDLIWGAIFGVGLSILVLLSFFLFGFILILIWTILSGVVTWVSSKFNT